MANHTVRRGIRVRAKGRFSGDIACILLGLGVILWSTQTNSMRTQSRGAALLSQPLGFVIGSPRVRVGDGSHELVTIREVIPGGVLDRAGALPGDIPIDNSFDLGISSFYAYLLERQGQIAVIRVVAGGDGPSLQERPIRALEIPVPIVAEVME